MSNQYGPPPPYVPGQPPQPPQQQPGHYPPMTFPMPSHEARPPQLPPPPQGGPMPPPAFPPGYGPQGGQPMPPYPPPGYGPAAQAPWPQQHAPQQAPWQAPRQPDNPFARLNEADPTGGQRLPYLLPGIYLLRIDKTVLFESRQKKLFYINEVTVVASNVRERPAGTRCSAMIDMSNADMRDINLKRLIAAVLGADPRDEKHKGPMAPDGRPWDQHALESIGSAQPWAGKLVGCDAHEIETRSGDDFTVLGWMPAQEAQTRLAQMGTGAPLHPPQSNVGHAPATSVQGAPPSYGQPAQNAPVPSAPQPYGGPPQGQPPQGWPGWGR